jgi:hypothetical protein
MPGSTSEVRSGDPALKYGPSVSPGVARPEQLVVVPASEAAAVAAALGVAATAVLDGDDAAPALHAAATTSTAANAVAGNARGIGIDLGLES